MLKLIIFTSLFSFNFCISSRNQNEKIEKFDFKQSIIVIRETPLYEYPEESKQYRIGICKEGTIHNVDSDFTNL